MRIGSVVTAKVNSVSDFGIDASTIPGNVRALIPKSSLAEGQQLPKPGDKIDGVVVHVEPQFGCVEISLNPDLVRQVVTKKTTSPKVGQVVKGSLVVAKSELGFVLVCVKSPPQLTGHFVHVPTRQHINDKVNHLSSRTHVWPTY